MSEVDAPIAVESFIFEINRLFEAIAERELAGCFKRKAMNNRALAELGFNINKRGHELTSVSDIELLMIKRAHIWMFSGLRSNLQYFRWTRHCALLELSKQALVSAEAGSLLMVSMALRSIIEIVGNYHLLTDSLRRHEDPDNTSESRMNWLYDIDALMDDRLNMLRVDYQKMMEFGLKSANKIKYKPREYEKDSTAKDMLNGVDAMSKKTIGARGAYDFFSEFAHPNLASAWTNYDETEFVGKCHDIHFYYAKHQRLKPGKAFMANFGAAFLDAIKITLSCVVENFLGDDTVSSFEVKIGSITNKVIRESIRRDPRAFDAREPCPCDSGKRITACCGNLVSPKKFGKYSFVLIH